MSRWKNFEALSAFGKVADKSAIAYFYLPMYIGWWLFSVPPCTKEAHKILPLLLCSELRCLQECCMLCSWDLYNYNCMCYYYWLINYEVNIWKTIDDRVLPLLKPVAKWTAATSTTSNSVKALKAKRHTHTHTHTRFWPFFRDYPGKPVPER